MSLSYAYKKITIRDVPRVNRKKTPFLDVFRVSESKFVSCCSEKKIKQLSKMKELVDQDFSDLGAVMFSMTINAVPVYERYKANSDTFTLLASLERSIQVVAGLTPINYEVFFSEQERVIKVRFFFLNYHRLNDAISIKGSLSLEVAQRLSDSLESKVASYSGLTLKDKAVEIDKVMPEVVLPDAPDQLSELEQNAYSFATLMLDPYYRQAMARALRGLDKRRATEMLNRINRLADSVEVDIEHVELPKKHSQNNVKVVDSSVVHDSDLDDVFS